MLKSSYLTEGRGGSYQYSKRAVIKTPFQWPFAGVSMMAPGDSMIFQGSGPPVPPILDLCTLIHKKMIKIYETYAKLYMFYDKASSGSKAEMPTNRIFAESYRFSRRISTLRF